MSDFEGRSLAAFGGGLGRHASPRARSAAVTVAPLLLVTSLMVALGVVMRGHCVQRGWNGSEPFTRMCFSDLTSQLAVAHLHDGPSAWLSPVGDGGLDQPVLTAAAMTALAWITPGTGDADVTRTYFLLWAVVAALLMMAVTWLVARTPTASFLGLTPARRAAMVAFSPILALAVMLSADVVGVALATAGVWAWSRRRPGLAGVLLGLAVMARSYPLLILVAIVLTAGRVRRSGDAAFTVVSALLTMVGVALPLLVLAPEALWRPYDMWWDSPVGLGTVQRIPDLLGHPLPPNAAALLAIVGWCAALALGVLLSGRRGWPLSTAHLALVMVGVVLVTGKSFTLQSALWLVPLLALTSIAWRDVLVWAAAEAAHFVALWLYLSGTVRSDRGLPAAWYAVFVVLRTLGVLWVVLQVAEDEGDERALGAAGRHGAPGHGGAGPVWTVQGAPEHSEADLRRRGTDVVTSPLPDSAALSTSR